MQLPGHVKLFHANMLKNYIERRNEEESLELVGAAVIEESQGVEIGEIAEFVRSQKEDYTHVNVNPELTPEQKEEMTNVLAEFSDVFTDVPKVTTLGVHSINLTNMAHIRSKAYPLPFAIRESVVRELDSMLASGVTAYAFFIVVVKKPDSSNRICVDFRKLNKVTIFDPEPMPQMQEIFAELSLNHYLSKFDFCEGYWQVSMLEEDKDLTTFVTHRGLFRFTVIFLG